ncbi:unnamed protein product [Didymodactylos carnosus]|uniref:Uncharacterized protein n=1 Tax=Didymodactylos carnosus TaxID=1234261 RepID=A0A8S2EAG3_9BILA|nr:unnamed protein product [Didymodactylos carnosus]CAF3982199.1 unnamed protein product [Didymodactylos carnosus]
MAARKGPNIESNDVTPPVFILKPIRYPVQTNKNSRFIESATLIRPLFRSSTIVPTVRPPLNDDPLITVTTDAPLNATISEEKSVEHLKVPNDQQKLTRQSRRITHAIISSPQIQPAIISSRVSSTSSISIESNRRQKWLRLSLCCRRRRKTSPRQNVDIKPVENVQVDDCLRCSCDCKLKKKSTNHRLKEVAPGSATGTSNYIMGPNKPNF